MVMTGEQIGQVGINIAIGSLVVPFDMQFTTGENTVQNTIGAKMD